MAAAKISNPPRGIPEKPHLLREMKEGALTLLRDLRLFTVTAAGPIAEDRGVPYWFLLSGAVILLLTVCNAPFVLPKRTGETARYHTFGDGGISNHGKEGS